MKFKIDENLPIELAELLNAAEHDALTVYDERLQGKLDPEISSVCVREERCLVTLDLDFADIRTYPPKNLPGIIVLRLTHQDKLHILNVFRNLIPLLGSEKVSGLLWIVEEKRVRIRGEDD